MDFHVSTPVETELVMKTENGRVIEVWPAPLSSRPVVDELVPPAPDR
jgi:hypothetical protein